MFQPMSHSESVYNILPPKPEMVRKPRLFKSKVSAVPPTASTFHGPNTTNPHSSNLAGDAQEKVVKDRCHATFGTVPGALRNKTENYTKKFSKSFSVPSLRDVKKNSPNLLRPSTVKDVTLKGSGGPPRNDEIPVMNLVTTKNFIVANAVEAILAAPKKTVCPKIDWFKKEDFGKAPKYLTKVKRDINTEYDYIRKLQEQQERECEPSGVIRPLDDDDRLNILDGLKAKWEQTNHTYQGMTHLGIMESGQKKRKEGYEAELASLEKDIEKLGRHSIAVDLSA